MPSFTVQNTSKIIIKRRLRQDILFLFVYRVRLHALISHIREALYPMSTLASPNVDN